MYDSAPTAREGERIEALAPEAIDATANSANLGSSRRPATGSLAGSARGTIRLLATLVIVEAMALLALLLMWAF